MGVKSRKSIVCSSRDLLVSLVLQKRAFKIISQSRNKYKFLKKMRETSERLNLKTHWSIDNPRTVLSWLIHSGVIFCGEMIRFCNVKNGMEVKEGSVTRDGILCSCCKNVFSIDEFKKHAGSVLNSQDMDLVMESGKLLILCQLEAWAAEYKIRKASHRIIGTDEQDDYCGYCGTDSLEQKLLCCDNCPATFHRKCLLEKKISKESWYCRRCCCRTCLEVVKEKDASLSSRGRKCSMCKHKYHEKCMQGSAKSTSDTWFCQESCYEVYMGLQSRLGSRNPISDGISWTLLRCVDGDFKTHCSHKFLSEKAECNAKLAVALTLMEHEFSQMADDKTGINMIAQAMYNWGSRYGRLDFDGFHTVVLEENDVIVAVASIRIHGAQVAELPFVATCPKRRGKGLCRILTNSIVEMLKSLDVQKLLVPAHEEVVDMWKTKFGFRQLDRNEMQNIKTVDLMLLPGSIWLEKAL